VPEVGPRRGPAVDERGRLAASLAALAVLYVLLIGLGDARAWSGSDAGGKVATIRYMAEHHTLVPEVGYWASAQDPAGTFHPLVKTTLVGHRFIQVTTFPFVYIGLPLWRLWGAKGVLVLPVIGSLLAAVSARRLARVLGATKGWWAFWLVGAASPMLFYSADFWEHSMGVGLALLAVSLALEEGGPLKAAAAGLAAGTAGVLRADVLVYIAAAGVAILIVGRTRRWWFAHPARAVAITSGALVPLVASRVAEHVLVASSGARAGIAGRSVGAVSQAGSMLPQRVRDGVLTTVGLFADDSSKYLVLGAVVLGAMVILVVNGRRAEDGVVTKAAFATVVAAYAARLAGGIGFVPGMFAAGPVSSVGVIEARTPQARVVLITALLAIPAVWYFQWQGELIPQWGGRYLLVSGALLAVLGAVAIERAGRLNAATGVVVLAAVVITGFGAVWHVQRTRSVAHAVSRIEAVPADVVVVSELDHLGREAGAWYGRHRWLTASSAAQLEAVGAILRASQVTQVEVVGLERSSAPAVIPGYGQVSVDHVDFLGFPLRLTMLNAR